MPTPAIVTETTARTIARWVLALFYLVAGVAHLIVTDAMVTIALGEFR